MRSKSVLLAAALLLSAAPAVLAQPVPVPPVTTVAAPAPPAPPLRIGPASPVPKFHLGQLITMRDYPEKPRKKRQGGTTEFSAEIDSFGTVKRCTITASSGSKDLDKAACKLFSARATFDPAIDRNGDPAVGFYPGRVVWDLTRIVDAPLPGTVTHTFDVAVDGTVSNCRIATVTGAAAKQYRPGPETCRHTAFDSDFRLPEALRKPRRVIEVETIVVEEVPELP